MQQPEVSSEKYITSTQTHSILEKILRFAHISSKNVNSQNFLSAGPVEKVPCDTQLDILSLYLKILQDFF